MELEKEVRFYEDSYYKFKEEMEGYVREGGEKRKKVGKVVDKTLKVLVSAELFLAQYGATN